MARFESPPSTARQQETRLSCTAAFGGRRTKTYYPQTGPNGFYIPHFGSNHPPIPNPSLRLATKNITESSFRLIDTCRSIAMALRSHVSNLNAAKLAAPTITHYAVRTWTTFENKMFLTKTNKVPLQPKGLRQKCCGPLCPLGATYFFNPKTCFFNPTLFSNPATYFFQP